MQMMEFFREEEGYKLRAANLNGQEWFVAKDVCDILGISNAVQATDRLDADEVCKTEVIDALGRAQPTTIINESGLYALIFRSNKPRAREFRKWVTAEVLPAIRQHGAFSLVQNTAAPPMPVEHPVTQYITAFDALRARGISPDKAVYSLGNVFQSSLAGAYQSYRQVLPLRIPDAPPLPPMPSSGPSPAEEPHDPEGFVTFKTFARQQGQKLTARQRSCVLQSLRKRKERGEIEVLSKKIRVGWKTTTVNLYPIDAMERAFEAALGKAVA